MLVSDASTLVAGAQEFLERVVIVERAAGTSWEDIGTALGITKQSAHSRFTEAEKRWREALDEPEVPQEYYGMSGEVETRTVIRLPYGAAEPAKAAAELDAWVRAHRRADPHWYGDDDERPVSTELTRMDPLTEHPISGPVRWALALREHLPELTAGPPPAIESASRTPQPPTAAG